MKKMTNEEYIKEFEETFADCGGEYSSNIDAPRSMLKSFLLSALQKKDEEVVKDCEDRRFPNVTLKVLGGDMSPAEAYKQGTNSALDALIAKYQKR